MSCPDLSPEIKYQTTRSGGKGGQNVNKVETAVIASFAVHLSVLLTGDQKALINEALSARINKEGELQVKSQAYRTQLENKEAATRKIQELVEKALIKKKKRIATKIPKGVKEKRLDQKKKGSDIKAGRRKLRPGDY